MILELSQIPGIVKNPKSAHSLKEAVELRDKLDMHVNGEDTIRYLEQISNFENKDQLSLRQKTVISNRHVFSSIIRVINKIFTAKGGSKSYIMPEDKIPDLTKILSDMAGVNLQSWIKNLALNKYLTDPNGVILIEHNGKECYPTYKSSGKIHDYKRKGRKLEYLILKQNRPVGFDEQGDLYRIYDDAQDALVLVGDSSAKIIKEYNGEKQTFPNPWGRVPGFIIGDLLDVEDEMFDSRFSVAVELADKYLRTNSVKNVYEFAHGYPIFWKYLSAKCIPCNGSGQLDGRTCPHCYGTGYSLKKDVSDVIGIKPPANADQVKLAPDIAGYVQPDLETWREFRTELDWLEKLIQFSILGSYTREKADNNTATGAFIDSQPVNDSLDDYAAWAETTEKMIADFVGEYHFQSVYKGSSINLGRRYMIESPDVLWKKYTDSKTAGSPTDKLDDDVIEYLEAKYSNDPKNYEIHRKLFFVNDYRHLTIQEAKDCLPDAEYQKRLYYDSWVITLSDDYILKTPITELYIKYIEFVNSKKTSNA